jgi:sugar phosphate isomerase/epimerase
MMRIGIFAKTFRGESPRGVLENVARAGFDAAQYNMACSGIGALPVVVEEATAVAVRAASEETSVAIAAISVTYNMIHPDLATRKGGRASFSAIASRARAMGANLLTVCTGSCDPQDQWRHHPDNSGAAAWRTMCEEFQYLLEIAERCDISIGVEPELANVVSTAERARELIGALGSNRIRIVLDPANLFEVETPHRQKVLIERAVNLFGENIALAHAKDRNANGGFTRAGAGVIDFAHFLAALRRVGFDGAIVTHGLSAAEAPGVSRFLRVTLALLQ